MLQQYQCFVFLSASSTIIQYLRLGTELSLAPLLKQQKKSQAFSKTFFLNTCNKLFSIQRKYTEMILMFRGKIEE